MAIHILGVVSDGKELIRLRKAGKWVSGLSEQGPDAGRTWGSPPFQSACRALGKSARYRADGPVCFRPPCTTAAFCLSLARHGPWRSAALDTGRPHRWPCIESSSARQVSLNCFSGSLPCRALDRICSGVRFGSL